MRITIISLLAIVTVVHTMPVSAQQDAQLYGYTVHVKPRNATRLAGELLAVESDSVWLMISGQPRALPLSDLESVQIRKGGVSDSGIFVWSLVGGVATGVPLMLACSTVAENCGGVLPGTMVAWLVVGGLSALFTGSPHRNLDPEADAIRPYARFPQGLPPGFGRLVTPGSALPVQRPASLMVLRIRF